MTRNYSTNHPANLSRELTLIGAGISSLEHLFSPKSSTDRKLDKTYTPLCKQQRANLEIINVHANHLQNIRIHFALPKLHTLNVSSNDLNILDFRELESCPSLYEIDASANYIHTVTNIRHVTTLQKLKLAFNVIQTLEWLSDAYGSSLQWLDLRQNRIASLQELQWLAGCAQLRHVWLQNENGQQSNPVCTHRLYAASIFRMCPQVQTLDGKQRDEYPSDVLNVDLQEFRKAVTQSTLSDVLPCSPRSRTDSSGAKVEQVAAPTVTTSVADLTTSQAQSTDSTVDSHLVTSVATSLTTTVSQTMSSSTSTKPTTLATPHIDHATQRYKKRISTTPGKDVEQKGTSNIQLTQKKNHLGTSKHSNQPVLTHLGSQQPSIATMSNEEFDPVTLTHELRLEHLETKFALFEALNRRRQFEDESSSHESVSSAQTSSTRSAIMAGMPRISFASDTSPRWWHYYIDSHGHVHASQQSIEAAVRHEQQRQHRHSRHIRGRSAPATRHRRFSDSDANREYIKARKRGIQNDRTYRHRSSKSRAMHRSLSWSNSSSWSSFLQVENISSSSDIESTTDHLHRQDHVHTAGIDVKPKVKHRSIQVQYNKDNISNQSNSSTDRNQSRIPVLKSKRSGKQPEPPEHIHTKEESRSSTHIHTKVQSRPSEHTDALPIVVQGQQATIYTSGKEASPKRQTQQIEAWRVRAERAERILRRLRAERRQKEAHDTETTEHASKASAAGVDTLQKNHPILRDDTIRGNKKETGPSTWTSETASMSTQQAIRQQSIPAVSVQSKHHVDDHKTENTVKTAHDKMEMLPSRDDNIKKINSINNYPESYAESTTQTVGVQTLESSKDHIHTHLLDLFRMESDDQQMQLLQQFFSSNKLCLDILNEISRDLDQCFHQYTRMESMSNTSTVAVLDQSFDCQKWIQTELNLLETLCLARISENVSAASAYDQIAIQVARANCIARLAILIWHCNEFSDTKFKILLLKVSKPLSTHWELKSGMFTRISNTKASLVTMSAHILTVLQLNEDPFESKARVQQLEEFTEQLREQNKTLQVELDHRLTREEHAKLEMQVQDAQEDFKTQHKAFTDLKERYKHVEEEVKSLRESNQETNATLQRERTEAAETISSLKASLARIEQQHVSLADASRYTQEQLAQQAAQAVTKVQQLEEQKNALESAFREEQQNAASTSSEAKWATSELNKWKERYVTLENETRKQLEHATNLWESRLQAQIEAAEEEIKTTSQAGHASLKALQTSFEKHKHHTRQLEQQLHIVQQERTRALGQVRKLQKEHSQDLKRLDEVTDELKQLRRYQISHEEAQKIEGKYSELQQQYQSISAQYEKAQQELTQQQTQINSLQQKCQSAEQEVRIKVAMLDDQNDTIKTLKKQFNSLQEDAHATETGLRDALKDLQADNRALRSRNESLHSGKTELETRANRAQAESSSLREVVRNLEGIVTELRTKNEPVDVLQQKLTEKDIALRYVEQEVQQLKSLFDSKEQSIRYEMQTKIDQIENEKQSLQHKVTQMKLSIENKEKTLAEQSHTVKQLSYKLRQSHERVKSTEREMEVLLKQLDEEKQKTSQHENRLRNALQQLQSVLQPSSNSPSQYLVT